MSMSAHKVLLISMGRAVARSGLGCLCQTCCGQGRLDSVYAQRLLAAEKHAGDIGEYPQSHRQTCFIRNIPDIPYSGGCVFFYTCLLT